MPILVQMPKLTDTMEEGVLVRWAKKEGDSVEPGDILAEIETDKATMEYEAMDRGVLLKIVAQVGSSIKPGEPIAVIGKKGEDPNAVLGSAPTRSSSTSSSSVPSSAPSASPVSSPMPDAESRRRPASPLARRMAREAGVAVDRVVGTGPGGRVVRRDIETAISRAVPEAAPMPATQASTALVETSEPLSLMRKTIARRMVEAKREAPHFYVTREVDAEPLTQIREQLARDLPDAKASINDLIVRACALALRAHPAVNSSFAGDRITRHARVDVGIAVAIPDGLVTPVVRNADTKSLVEVTRESRDLAERARARKLKPEEMQNATFTISNLGMFGVSQFAAILSPPEAAILAVGAILKKPVVRGEQVVVGRTIMLTLSCDHRTIDGATAAQFLTSICDYLEHPLRIVL